MFKTKVHGMFMEVTSFSHLVATTSNTQPPFVIETLREFSASSEREALRAFIEGFKEGKNMRYLRGHCAVYPESRFFRRHSVESAAKIKEARYFPELLTNQFRIDPTRNMASVVVATDGSDFDLEKPLATQKELLICGAGMTDLERAQEGLLECSVFPDSLQLGTVATCGAIVNYLQWKAVESPTLLLEISPESANLFIVSGAGVDLCRPVPFGLNAMFPLVQSELKLRDEESARKLLFSNTFDFTEMGPALLRKLLKELQASTGFYEVQTGRTIEHLVVTLLPKNLRWVEQVLAKSIGLQTLSIDFRGWLEAQNIKAGELVQLDNLEPRWLGLVSLMLDLKEARRAA